MARTSMHEAVRLGAATEALAALAAHTRLETEQLPADPAVRTLLRAIAVELLGDDAVHGPPAVVGVARTLLRQAADLVEDPGRSGGWDTADVPLVQSMGRMSMGIGDALRAAEQLLPDLGERLHAPGARFLDVGTGAGWLAVAIARQHPGLALVGMDVSAPVLEIARGNVAAEGLSARIELRRQDAAELDDPAGFDAVWVPLPFLPREVVPAVVQAAIRSLRPGGWLLPGVFAGPPDPLSELLTDLRTVRCGGHPWRPAEVTGLLNAAGLADAQEVPRSWDAPVRLFAGRCD